MSQDSFRMRNSQENVDILNDLTKQWYPGHETCAVIEVCIEDHVERRRVKSELLARSSAFF